MEAKKNNLSVQKSNPTSNLLEVFDPLSYSTGVVESNKLNLQLTSALLRWIY